MIEIQNHLSNEVSLALIAAVASFFAALMTTVNMIVARSMRIDMRTLEKNTNSMKDALVKVVGESQRAQGKLEGKAEEKAECGDQRAQGKLEGVAEEQKRRDQ